MNSLVFADIVMLNYMQWEFFGGCEEQMVKRRFFSIALAIVLCVSMIGCTFENRQTEQAASSLSEIDTQEHVVIDYLTIGNQPDGVEKKNLDDMLNKLNKRLTELCNAELSISYIGWDNYLMVYNLNLSEAAGRYDLVGTASDWLDAWSNVKNGYFLPLSEEMLETYAPKTWESVSDTHWDMCKYENQIYLMPEDNYTQWSNQGFAYRIDWAKTAGLHKGVTSWEDLDVYVKYVVAHKDELGLDVIWDVDYSVGNTMISGWINSHSKIFMLDGLSSNGIWGGYEDDIYTMKVPVMEETAMIVDYARMMQEWNQMQVFCPIEDVDNRELFSLQIKSQG